MSMNSYRTIVVGTDGSELATPTVTRAAWLATHEDADLIIVCAYSAITQREAAVARAALTSPANTGEAQGRKQASDALFAATAHANGLGATVTASLLIEGDAAQALLQVCDDRDADLLVVGARQDASLTERILGSVASEVVRKALCEVLIVRPRDDRAQGVDE